MTIERLAAGWMGRYASEGVFVSKKELVNKLKELMKNAKGHYVGMSGKRLVALSVYVQYWVEEEMLKDLMAKTTRSVARGSVLDRFLGYVPLGKDDEWRSKIYGSKEYGERMRVWKSLRLPVSEIEASFRELVRERNCLAVKKGFHSYVEMAAGYAKMPRNGIDGYEQKQIDVVRGINERILGYLEKEKIVLPMNFLSELNEPCYLCLLAKKDDYKLSLVGELHDLVSSSPALSRVADRIRLIKGDGGSMRYVKELDCFEVKVSDRLNSLHQKTELIHELGHVTGYLKFFDKGVNPLVVGKYANEKEAVIFQRRVLSKKPERMFMGVLGEVLWLLRRTNFEIGVYRNPDQDLSRLYALTFNQCFQGANQESNFGWLLDRRVTMLPLTSLAQAVAWVDVLDKWS